MKLSMKARSAAVAILLCTAIVPALAQQPGGPGGEGRPPRGPGNALGQLVRMGTVQKELQLTQNQIQQINELRPPQGGPGGPGRGPDGPPPQGGPGGGGPGGPPNGGQGGFGGGPGGPPQDGQAGPGGPGGFAGGAVGQRGPGGMQNNPLAKILTPDQMGRLKQLGLQFEAPMSFLQPDVSDALGLDDSARQSIDQIVRKHMVPPQQGQRPDWKTMMANKAAAFKEAYATLSGEAKQAWSKLTGKAFTNWEEPKRQ